VAVCRYACTTVAIKKVAGVGPANESEAPHLPHLLKGCTAVRVLADKACSSETNRAALARQGLESGDRVPGETEPSAKRLAEEVQPAGGETTLDHRAGFWNAQGSLPWGLARYIPREKVEAELTLKATAMNRDTSNNPWIFGSVPSHKQGLSFIPRECDDLITGY